MTTASQPDVLVIGESLVDIIETDAGIAKHPGGSPANVALGLARRGLHCSLLTQLGDDANGAMIAGHLRESAVEVLPASFGTAPTSTAIARIAADGHARYEFDVTWNAFATPISVAPGALHVGSIATFLEPGASSVRHALEASTAAHVTFDPNVRPLLMPPHDVTVRSFENTSALATAVKMSDEDAGWLYPELRLEDVMDIVFALGVRLCAITMGSDGALVATPDQRIHVPAPPVVAVDTIGAGDTFMASLISSLLADGDPNTQDELQRLGAQAVHAAAITVSRAGADLPWARELWVGG